MFTITKNEKATATRFPLKGRKWKRWQDEVNACHAWPMLIGANFANWNCRVHMDTLFAYETCWFAWLYFNTFRPIPLWYPCLLPIDISVLRSFTSAVLAPITTIISKHWICQWKSWFDGLLFVSSGSHGMNWNHQTFIMLHYWEMFEKPAGL